MLPALLCCPVNETTADPQWNVNGKTLTLSIWPHVGEAHQPQAQLSYSQPSSSTWPQMDTTTLSQISAIFTACKISSKQPAHTEYLRTDGLSGTPHRRILIKSSSAKLYISALNVETVTILIHGTLLIYEEKNPQLQPH
ncbi:hypothetical protein MHYP_G00123750 [Metynnis hypsauchen]